MTMMMRAAFLLVALVAGVHGFAPPRAATTTPLTNTQLFAEMTQADAAPDLPENLIELSYGEIGRPFRRTVYSHDDWRKHRRSDRFIYYLSSFLTSGVYTSIGREVLATTTIAAIVCLYNAIVGGYVDFQGQQHAALISSSLLPLAGLPLAPFTLSSPSLGLLLGKCQVVECASPFCRKEHSSSNTLSPPLFSLSHQHFVPTLGRSSKELGNEYQSHS